MRPDGYATLTDRESGKTVGERDTHQCCHNGCIIHMPPNGKVEEVAEFCRNCMKLHCLKPQCIPCLHFMKKIEIDEAAAAAYLMRRRYV